MRLSIEHLSKSFRQGDKIIKVLDDLALVVEQGAFVVLTGKSGSGKSTLLNLIGGLDTPDAGSVRFDSTVLTALGEPERTLLRRRHIGIVFQSYNLIPTLTVEENLQLPLTLLGRTPVADACRQWLERVELLDKADAFPDQLSGGEQQRVAIARALIHEPAIVLADEPTGNLDLATAKSILALLDDSLRAAGKTLLMVTHSREVVGFADRVLELRNGRLV
jgi:putative ABC transport system ATP-binding protein